MHSLGTALDYRRRQLRGVVSFSFRLFHRCNLSDIYLALLHVVCRLRLFGVSWQCVKYRFDVFVMSQRQHFADADCGLYMQPCC